MQQAAVTNSAEPFYSGLFLKSVHFNLTFDNIRDLSLLQYDFQKAIGSSWHHEGECNSSKYPFKYIPWSGIVYGGFVFNKRKAASMLLI